jgi:hypothetical protein
MSRAPANLPKPQIPETATSRLGRCVAAIPQPALDRMKEQPANQLAKPKPSPPASAALADVQMVLAKAKLIGAEAKKIRAVAQLIGMLTGLLYVVLPYIL